MRFDPAFKLAMIFKGLNGLLESIFGLLLFCVPLDVLNRYVTLFQSELSNDPKDHIARAILHFCQAATPSSKMFAGFYLLGHGIIKLGLVVGMLKRITWVYPCAIAFLLAFISYQIYRFTRHYSTLLIILSALDAIVVVIVWFEYQKIRVNTGRAAKVGSRRKL